MAYATRESGLAGRRGEVARLDASLERLGGRDPTPLAISGEPGIGKSRLLGELLERAERTGTLTLSGRAAQLERDVPFAVFVDALDGYLGSQNPRRFESLGRERLTELGRIFPSLAEHAKPARGAGQSERYRAHHAVRAMLELLARPRALVLTLDDMQWADEASLELAAHLLRRAPRAAVLLAVAFRPGETPSRLADALDDALRDDRLDQIVLGPLSPAEAGEMLPGELGIEARERLIRDSGGNPFYLEQLLRSPGAMAAEAGAEPVPELGEDVPRAVAAALAQEVAALSPPGRLLLDGAAVAGDPFAIELALAAAEIGEQQGLAALDELLGRGLARPTEVSRRFAFRHPIVRKTVYVTAARGWRIGAHARVREALRENGAPATELAHHVEQAAVPGDIDAIAVLEEAGRTSAQLAPALSARWLAAAVRLLPEKETARRSELLLHGAMAYAATGRLEEARSVLTEAIELLPVDPGRRRAELSAFLGALSNMLGHHKENRAQLRENLAGLADPTSAEAAALQVELGIDRVTMADWEGAREWADRAFAAASASGQEAILITSDVIRCCAALGMGQIGEADRYRAVAAMAVDELDDAEFVERLDGPWGLGFCEYFLGHHEDGVQHMERAIAVSRSAGRGHLLAQMKLINGWHLVQLGRVQDGIAMTDEAIEAARLTGNPQALAWALSVRCWIAGVLGDVPLAVRTGEEAVTVGAARDECMVQALAHAHLGVARLLDGEYELCIEEMEIVGAPEFPDFFAERKPIWCEALARAALGRGRDEEAEVWVARAEAFAEPLGLPIAAAPAQRARARLLLTQDQPEAAAELALMAAESQIDRGSRVEAAHTRLVAGRALAKAAERARAIEQFELAHEEFEEFAAVRHCDEAARGLRLLGRRVPRRGRRGIADTGVESLSERERQIAELVAEAKTNREIAAELFISEKTVEKHLSRVFVKLEVSGRAAVGAKLVAGAQI